MNIKTIIILILAINLFLSCDSKQKQIETNHNEIGQVSSKFVKSETTIPIEKNKADKIVGKYYVDNFYEYLKTGFELKTKKPEDRFILYTFEFKNNGELIFDDLTEFYGCGNGVLSIQKGKWSINENGFYQLDFDGEYALDHKFHTESEYRLVDLENGNFHMKLNKILMNEKNSNWE